LKSENTAASASVIVTVMVSALPLSSDARILLTKAVVAVGQVYSVVTEVAVKSTLALV
jgi:hypothetical protein